jgi:hypothetical protein
MPNKFYLKVDFFNANVKGQKHGKANMNFVCPCVEIELLVYVEHKWKMILNLIVGNASQCFDLVILGDAKALQIKRECNRV